MKFFYMLLMMMVLFAPQADAGDLINKHLPDYLKVDIQARYRLEYRDKIGRAHV